MLIILIPILGYVKLKIRVESTARDAYERGYNLIFAQDAMAARTKADHNFAVTRIFPRIGRVRQTGQIITAIKQNNDFNTAR